MENTLFEKKIMFNGYQATGDNDTCFPFDDNGRYMVEYCKNNNILLKFILKKNCGHHPHSLENVKPIIDFVENGRL